MTEPTSRSPAIAGVLDLAFREQVAFFRGKLGNLVATKAWDDLKKSQHDTAFMVAGAAKADLLADLAGAVDKAIADGHGPEWFRKNFESIVAKHGWTGWTGEGSKAGRAWRARVIYETNLATSYAAGRLAQLREGGFKFWLYKHSDSVMHPRPLHLAWNGMVLAADDPFWKEHFPPNGWGCRCRVVGVNNLDNARALGGDPGKKIDPDWAKLSAKTGEPVGIDKGWGYMPGASAVDRIGVALLTKAGVLPMELGDALAADLAKRKPSFDFNGLRPGLDDLPPLRVTELTGSEFGSDLSKQGLAMAADALLRTMQRGPGLPNDDTGWILRVNKDGRKKMGDNADLSAAESKSVAGLESLARNAVVSERHPDIEHRNPDVAAVYRLYAPLTIDNNLYRVKLTVKDYVGQSAKKELHALAAVEIERAPPGIFPSYTSAEALQTGQPTTGRSLSIADLLRGATMNNGKPFDLEWLK